MRNIVLIPARMQATRFPNKPLADILGVPMIMRVVQQSLEADIGEVYVACGDKEIYDCVVSNGGNAVMTDNDLPTGTDRIYQALTKINQNNNVDGVINVQGDIPTIDPSVIRLVAGALSNPDVDITTACAKIIDETEINDPNVVKAYVDFADNNISTAIDFKRDAIGNAPFYHHIGIYGYKSSSLKKFISMEVSENEKLHRLEQLRALDGGMRIDACLVDDVPLGVDVESDLVKAINIIKNQTA